MTTIAPPRVGQVRRGATATPDRIAPPPLGLREPPRESAVRYAMPRRRLLWLGWLVSLALHGVFFYGFNAVTPPASSPTFQLTTEQLALFEAPPEKPPERKTEDDAATEDEARASNPQDFAAASLPEPISMFSLDTVQMELSEPPPPIPPRPEGFASFEIPQTQHRRPTTGTYKQLETFNLDELDKKPEVIVQSPPNYPFEEKRQGIEGDVLLRFIVDRKGAVQEPYVVRSAARGFESPALAAILRWKFKPGVKNGRTVNTRMELSIRFMIEKD